MKYDKIQTLISFATCDFPDPGKPLSIITILEGLLGRPGGHNNVSMVNNCRLHDFSTSLILDTLGGDGAQSIISITSGFGSFSISSSSSTIVIVSIVIGVSLIISAVFFLSIFDSILSDEISKMYRTIIIFD